MNELLVPFGLRDGILYEPSQVPIGKACGCICPSCNSPLIGRRGSKRPHFAHAADRGCQGGLETAVHMAAKQLIAERMQLFLPAFQILLPEMGIASEILKPNRLIALDEVRLENAIGNIRPDIIAIESGKEILVEIAVTHFVDQTKKEKIKARGSHAIEIDLSRYKASIDFAALSEVLFETPKHSYWLFHPDEEPFIRDAISRLKAKQDEEANIRTAERLERQRRLDRYKALSPNAKTEVNMRSTGMNEAQLKALTCFVPGEKSFGGNRHAWQTSVIAYINNEATKNSCDGDFTFGYVDADALIAWLQSTYDIQPQFPDAERIAVWKYLKHLESLNILQWVSRRLFEMRLDSRVWRPTCCK